MLGYIPFSLLGCQAPVMPEMGPSPCFSEYETAGTEAVVLTPGHSDDDAGNHEELRKQGWVCVLQA